MEVWFYGLPFFVAAMVGTSLMRAAGDVATPGYLMAVGSFLQVLFGPAQYLASLSGMALV